MADGNEGSRARSRSRSRARRKVFRNPFLNFIQDFMKELRCPLPYKEVLIRAGKEWRRMPADKKRCYKDQAARAPRRSRRSGRSTSRSRRRSRGNMKCDHDSANRKERNPDLEDDEASTSTCSSEE